MIKKFIELFSSFHFPWVDKKFNLNHYFKIERKLEKLNKPFAIGLVSTYGHGSNVLVKFVQFLTKKTRNSLSTHAFVVISNKEHNFRVAEFVGGGLREATLLSSIGNRDVVKLFVPNQLMSDEQCRLFVKYINIVLARDSFSRLKYDIDHNIDCEERFDCSELIYHAMNSAMGKGHLRPVKRLFRNTWTPADIEHIKEFDLIYDSNE